MGGYHEQFSFLHSPSTFSPLNISAGHMAGGWLIIAMSPHEKCHQCLWIGHVIQHGKK